MPDELSEQPLFRENIKRLSGSGLTFDLCMLPRQLLNAMALADLAPDVTFILDHCGVPDIKGDARQPWRDHPAG
jgi:predicted TIM-barrel fold metal-dependent hydrolase